MRIIGLGNDLVDIRRIEKSLKRFEGRFKNRVFSALEIEYCHSKGNSSATPSEEATQSMKPPSDQSITASQFVLCLDLWVKLLRPGNLFQENSNQYMPSLKLAKAHHLAAADCL